MIRRLLDRLATRRSPLAVLVAVLSAMFVLTVGLAVRAHRSDVARERQAVAALQDVVAGGVADWGLLLQQRLVETLEFSFRRSLRELDRDPAVPLRALAGMAETEFFCPLCAQAVQPATFYSIDVASGWHEQTGPAPLPEAVLEGIRSRVAEGEYVLLRSTMATALHVFDVGGEPVVAAAFVQLSSERVPVRVVGYSVQPEALSENLARIFEVLPLLPPSLARLSKDTVFAVHATVGGATLLGEGIAGLPILATETLDRAPLNGLRLQVGVRDGAMGGLLLGGSAVSGLPLLIGVLVANAILIGMAVLLVRRETELARLRADFVSGVSHELRTPLAQIRMFTETLLLGRVRSDVERRRSLEIIDQEARRLTYLVENVLQFSKSETGRSTALAPEPTNVSDEIRSAAESFAPLCRSRSVELRLELQQGLTASVDRCALRQILVNLIDNALKYGPAGQRITVGAALFDDCARIWVDDEGPGIPVEERTNVFDSFYRLSRDAAGQRTGSGIGLAVVRELAALHGGRASAAAAPGGGARLMVELPGAHDQPAGDAGLAAAS